MSESKPIALIGAGDHAAAVLAAMPDRTRVCWCVDRRAVNYLGGLERIDSDEEFCAKFSSDDVCALITAVGNPLTAIALRRRLIEKYSDYRSPVIIAPTAIVDSSSQLGQGTQIMHRAVINFGTTIGSHTIINTGAIIEHGCTIGQNVFIGPGAVVCGNVAISDDVFIGAGAVISPGVNITSGAIVALGAAIVSNITEPGVYAGVPAHRIK